MTKFPYLFLIVNFAVSIFVILQLNNGVFTYGLDDAYISLGLARNIAQGHYGLQAVEVSSPSSSILWPFILAPFSFLPHFDRAPLALGLFFSLISLRILQKTILVSINKKTKDFEIYTLTTLCALIIGLNMVGTVIDGLEHSMQITLTIACAYGLILFYQDGKIRKWLILALILGSAIRYENLAVTVAVCSLIFLRGRWLAGILSMASALVIPAIFSLFLLNLGLNYLPNSVLIKLFLQKQMFVPVISNIVADVGIIMIFFVAVSALSLRNKNTQDSDKSLIWSVIFVFVAQMVFGSNMMYRYGLYCFAYAIPILIYTNRKLLATYFSDNKIGQNCARLVVGILCCLFPYTSFSLFYSVIAARDTYLLQHQMTSFVKNYYPKPVGVNDIGYISFYQDEYVLDFVGLSNEPIRKFVMLEDRRFGNQWMNYIVKEKNIGLVIIFSSWFGDFVPKEWKLLASMEFSKDIFFIETNKRQKLDFYATNSVEAQELQPLIKKFGYTIPEEMEFSLGTLP